MNTIMQTAFFAISGVLPREQAIEEIKHAIEKTYGKARRSCRQAKLRGGGRDHQRVARGQGPSHGNVKDRRGGSQFRKKRPSSSKKWSRPSWMPEATISPCPRSRLTARSRPRTTQWEKRNLALDIPVWEPDLCIQCGKCVFVCPHAVIRHKVYDEKLLADAPSSIQTHAVKVQRIFAGHLAYTVQVAPEDCTGCTLCVEACPVKDKTQVGRKAINMAPQPALREQEAKNWDFFMSLPDPDRKLINPSTIKNSQLLRPLFEFSGACAGCGETPYVKLVSQLFGDRTIVANATGCSSIYGGNLPTTPWAVNTEGRGPAWSNSLFEDNAEFGLGMRLDSRQTKRIRA